jgi:transaldolase
MSNKIVDGLKVKIFADGADKKSLLELAEKYWIKGLTTNPTLLKKAGVVDYKAFALDVLSHVKVKPISFEVFSDEFVEMKRQALEIASWGSNVYVKVPITNTRGESSIDLISDLSHSGVKVNATAIFTMKQITETAAALKDGSPSVISVFAGRIFDTGRDACQIMKSAASYCKLADKNIELLWASPRQIYDIQLAENVGCDIITVSHDLLAKINLLGKDLNEYSLETVKMFFNDASAAKYTV